MNGLHRIYHDTCKKRKRVLRQDCRRVAKASFSDDLHTSVFHHCLVYSPLIGCAYITNLSKYSCVMPLVLTLGKSTTSVKRAFLGAWQVALWLRPINRKSADSRVRWFGASHMGHTSSEELFVILFESEENRDLPRTSGSSS